MGMNWLYWNATLILQSLHPKLDFSHTALHDIILSSTRADLPEITAFYKPHPNAFCIATMQRPLPIALAYQTPPNFGPEPIGRSCCLSRYVSG